MPELDWAEPMEDTTTVQEKLQYIGSLGWWWDTEVWARIAEEEKRRREVVEAQRQRLARLAKEKVISLPSHAGRCAICSHCVHQFALCLSEFRRNARSWPRGNGSVRRRRSCRTG